MLPILLAAAAPLASPHGHDPTAARNAFRQPGFHAVAYVTDARSHGQIGDNLLSVNEAIRLHNGTLSFSQLSLTELSLLSLIPGTGSTTDVTWIDIDGSSTPIITVEQDLDPVLDTQFGCLIKGFNEPPLFDFSGANITHGFRVPANSANFEDLILSGGPYGIDAVQTDASGQVGLALRNVTFSGHAQFGLRVTGTQAGGIGRLVLGQCHFENLPNAIVHRELAANRTTIVESYDVTMRGISNGFDSAIGPGGSARYTLTRQEIAATGTALRIDRGSADNRIVLLEGTHVRAAGHTSCIVTNLSSALTQLDLSMWHLRGTAMALSVQGGTLGQLRDSSLQGNNTLDTPSQPAALRLENLELRGGVFTVQAASHPPLLSDLRLVNAALVAGPGTQLQVTNLSGENSSASAVAGSSLLCTGCHLTSAATGLTLVAPRAAPFFGSMAIQPEDVSVGGTVAFVADLPPGLFGLFALGFTDPNPVLLGQPLDVYSQPTVTFVLPGIYRLQQQFQWSIPNSPAFLAYDFCAHLAVLPDPGVATPHALHFPPGRRFHLQ